MKPQPHGISASIFHSDNTAPSLFASPNPTGWACCSQPLAVMLGKQWGTGNYVRCQAVRLVGSPWGKAVPMSPRTALPRQGPTGLQPHRLHSSGAQWAPRCQHPWGGDRSPHSPPAQSPGSSPPWALLSPARLLEVGSEWGDEAGTAAGIK